MPQRIQRKRTKGWRMPEGAIYVGRPSRWGNPYVVHEHTDRCLANGYADCPDWTANNRTHATAMYRYGFLYPITTQPLGIPSADEIRAELAGHDLVCWCPLFDKDGNRVPCHADVLLELANQGEVR